MQLVAPFLRSTTVPSLVGALDQFFQRAVEFVNARPPVGAMILWRASDAVPTGWIVANGATVGAEIYYDLAKQYKVTAGSFTLPNPPTPSASFVWLVAI